MFKALQHLTRNDFLNSSGIKDFLLVLESRADRILGDNLTESEHGKLILRFLDKFKDNLKNHNFLTPEGVKNITTKSMLNAAGYKTDVLSYAYEKDRFNSDHEDAKFVASEMNILETGLCVAKTGRKKAALKESFNFNVKEYKENSIVKNSIFLSKHIDEEKFPKNKSPEETLNSAKRMFNYISLNEPCDQIRDIYSEVLKSRQETRTKEFSRWL